MTQDSLLSLNNPIVFSLITLILILAVVFIYYRYIIIPMRKRHIEEEENLKLQHAELMALFAELSPDPILRFDDNGIILLSNEAAHKTFNKSLTPPSSIQKLFIELSDLNVEKFISEGDRLTFISDSGEKTFQWIVAGISHNKIGQIYGRDITELVKKEQELIAALKTAQKANALKDDFLSRISHEIRSPLTSIQGISRLISSDMKDELNEEYFEMLQLIENSSKRLTWTIDLIINMSQIHTNNLVVTKTDFDLVWMLRKLKHEFQSLADEKTIDFVFEPALKELIVNADEYSVEKIFVNLLDNAFKFTDKGSVIIQVQLTGGKKEVTIRDTGNGISQKYLDEIYTPFTQQEMGYSRSIDGIGLGLALVKKFTEVNNAEIDVFSELGKGTEFRVLFE